MYILATTAALGCALPSVNAESSEGSVDSGLSGLSSVPLNVVPVQSRMISLQGADVESASGPTPPPPPSGPPAALLSRLEISGASSLSEGSSAQYACTAIYIDGSSKVVVPIWSEDSLYASINTSGLLSVDDVNADALIDVVASFDGKTATHTVSVDDIPVVLTGVSISGVSELHEESSAQYVCIASYSDGSSSVVTPLWSENSTATEISVSGTMTTGNITEDESVMLEASFGGLIAEHPITVRYIPPVLSSILIIGPASLDEGTSASLICMASYSDGTYLSVTPDWSDNNSAVSITPSGTLSAGDISGDQSVVVTARFGEVSDTHLVSINYIAPVLSSLSISGPAVVDEKGEGLFVCYAEYSDGSRVEIQAEWSADSSTVSIDDEGQLLATDILVDASVTLTASFEGQDVEFPLTVRVADSQLIYPLDNFAGKTVRADIWNAVTEELLPLGELSSPDELIIENLTPNQWYWLTIQELNAASGTWVPVQENWINM